MAKIRECGFVATVGRENRPDSVNQGAFGTPTGPAGLVRGDGLHVISTILRPCCTADPNGQPADRTKAGGACGLAPAVGAGVSAAGRGVLQAATTSASAAVSTALARDPALRQ